MTKQKQLIILTHGVEDGINQILFGFKFALTLKSLGREVAVFLTGLAVKVVNKDHQVTIQGNDFKLLKKDIQQFVESGGELLACSTCVSESYCISNEKKLLEKLVDGVKLVGLSAIAEMSLNSKVTTF